MEDNLLPQDDSEPPGKSTVQTLFKKKIAIQKTNELFPLEELAPIFNYEHCKDNVRINFKSKFPISPHVKDFKEVFYPEISDAEWNNWHWQLKNRIRTAEQLEKFICLTADEYNALKLKRKALPLSLTPYYASLLDPEYNRDLALRKAVIPLCDEYIYSAGEEEDPLSEDHDSPVPGLVHRYPDRVLFLVTNFCSVNCRYCTRSRIITNEKYPFSMQDWIQSIEYIKQHPEVRDVLLSGGDPLTLADEKLEWLLKALRSIAHVEIIRIGTKVPMVLPMRITKNLCRMLKKYHPLWLSIHATHPDELTKEAQTACNRLADAGIPLGSQTVLLAGINDSVETMKNLFHQLLKSRVRPYYLYQCDPIKGSKHFRTKIEKGLEIIRGLRGFTSGYAIPHFVVDAPKGGGKIPILPNYIEGYDEEGNLILKNYEGLLYSYPDKR